MTDKEKIELLTTALKEIAKGEGPYSMNQLTHAENTIESMKKIAIETLDKLKGIS